MLFLPTVFRVTESELRRAHDPGTRSVVPSWDYTRCFLRDFKSQGRFSRIFRPFDNSSKPGLDFKRVPACMHRSWNLDILWVLWPLSQRPENLAIITSPHRIQVGNSFTSKKWKRFYTLDIIWGRPQSKVQTKYNLLIFCESFIKSCNFNAIVIKCLKIMPKGGKWQFKGPAYARARVQKRASRSITF